MMKSTARRPTFEWPNDCVAISVSDADHLQWSLGNQTQAQENSPKLSVPSFVLNLSLKQNWQDFHPNISSLIHVVVAQGRRFAPT